jgi:hypothetical protein
LSEWKEILTFKNEYFIDNYWHIGWNGSKFAFNSWRDFPGFKTFDEIFHSAEKVFLEPCYRIHCPNDLQKIKKFMEDYEKEMGIKKYQSISRWRNLKL